MSTFTYSIGPDTRIAFPAKPDARIRGVLKAHGFRWSPGAACWWRRGVNGAADFLAALERTIDLEAGIRRPDGACWDCRNPEGFFRPYGAATPVYCAACHAKRQTGAGPLGRHDGAFKEPAEDAGCCSDRAYEDRCADACGLFGGES